MVLKAADLLKPSALVPQFTIVDRQGRFVKLADAGILLPQRQFIEAFELKKNVLALKSRQLGITTIAILCLLAEALLSASSKSCLTITHEAEAMGRVNMILRVALAHLPRALQPALQPDNMRAIGLTHNESLFKQLMAGGRGQGRSFTFQALHATEMGLWPRGSAAMAGNDVDEQVWLSAQATLHADARRVVESTATGPGGIFHRMCRIVREDPAWAFLFFAWFLDPTYAIDVPAGWERTDEENELADLHGIDDRQLAWRRHKLVSEGYSLRRFRQEYPSTPDEPFLVSEGMWFDTEALNKLLALLAHRGGDVKDGWTWYLRPNKNKRHFIGVDPSGGTGRDQGVIWILNDRLEQIAIYSSRRTPPQVLGREAAKASAWCGGAPVLIELNNQFGAACYDAAKAAGAKLWRSPEGKPWFTGTWNNRSTKVALLDHAKPLVDQGYVTIRDPLTISECLEVREWPNGNIGAGETERSEANDDRCIAMCLALWCAKNYIAREFAEDIHAKIAAAREKRHRELGL